MGWETTIFRWLGFGRHNATAPALVPGELGELQLDAQGNLKVALAAAQTPTAIWHSPGGFAPRGLVKEGAGTLYRLVGSNEGSKNLWVMLFDAIAVPADGIVPLFAIRVAEGGSFTLNLGRGRSFGSGIVWAASSTPGQLTADLTASVWLNAEYA